MSDDAAPQDALGSYYEARAGEYEAIYRRPERQADLARLREWVARACAGRRVLELACGTGWWTEAAAERARWIVATDFAEAPLAIARRKRYRCPVDFVRMDAYAPACATAALDAGLAAFWWSHVPRARLPRFLAGFASRLTPGAVCLFIDNRYVEGSSTPLARTDAAGDSFQQRTLADGTRHEVMKNFPSAAQVRAALAAIGGRIDVLELDYFWAARVVLSAGPAPVGRGGGQTV